MAKKYDTVVNQNPSNRIGQTWNNRIITGFTHSGKNKTIKYICKCICGDVRTWTLDKIKKRKCHNCYLDFRHIGERYGKKVIIGCTHIENKRYFKARCDCGNLYIALLSQLKSTAGCKNCMNKYRSGMIFNGCTLIEKTESKKWKILCHCGKEYIAAPRFRKTNDGLKFVNCGCTFSKSYFEKAMKKIGYKFGKLKVIDVRRGDRHNYLICKCKCGNIIEVKNGHEYKSNSCGCLLKENNPRAEKKGNARFSNIEINTIRELHASKTYSFEEIKQMFNLNTNYLTRILKSHIWKSLPNFQENLKMRKR